MPSANAKSEASNDSRRQRILVVSIDGLTPRAVSRAVTPRLCGLTSEGGGCFNARTIEPPMTLPAHTSMLHGVSPDRHGITTNEPNMSEGSARSFLAVARDAGLSTAAVTGWQPMNDIIEPGAVTNRIFLDGGYNSNDRRVVTAALDLLATDEPDVTFVYLTAPDLAGHGYGWDSNDYRRVVSESDALLGELVDGVSSEVAVVVTTDHGGEGLEHVATTDAIMETFVVIRANRITAGSFWSGASILDIAPTVAEIAGFPAPPTWDGQSLVGSQMPVVDEMVTVLASLANHSYGEQVDMLAHCLQSAACARADGASDDLVLAALFHDIGHVLGEAAQWGLPGHAEVGARHLQAWLPTGVVEPIRLHVAAKRFLVATEPAYMAQLSVASQESLREQGGPLSQAEIDSYSTELYGADAVLLRRWDDTGKKPGASVQPLAEYRPMIQRALASIASEIHISPMWARDVCRCAECRDPGNGQHLIGATELTGWRVIESHRNDGGLNVLLRADDAREHRCIIAPTQPQPDPLTMWGSEHIVHRTINEQGGQNEYLDDFLADLAEYGIAIAPNVPTVPGQVVEFANLIGFVRVTNYGELFDVVTDPAPINLAYTPTGLPLHTDNPYRDPVPTVQLLHCLRSASSGGASVFCDGFRAAEQLRVKAPAEFRLLSETPVLFRFSAADVDLQARVPLIRLDADGHFNRVTVNNRSMEPAPLGPQVDAFYRAYCLFAEILADPANTIEVTLAEGEVVAFDNRRVLHGRHGFTEDGNRHLQGCYIDVDAVRSHERVRRSPDDATVTAKV